VGSDERAREAQFAAKRLCERQWDDSAWQVGDPHG